MLAAKRPMLARRSVLRRSGALLPRFGLIADRGL